MADKRPLNEIAPPDATFEEKTLELAYKARDSWRKNQSLWTVVLAVVVCAVGAWSFWAWKSRASEAEASRILGRGLIHLTNNRADSALAIFDRLAADHGGLACSKASLLAGDILLGRGDWKGAESRFRRAVEESKGLPLLDGGARRGLAASLIEQARFEEAAKELQSVVAAYAHTSVEVKDRDSEKPSVDDLPSMSLAFWQLVLVQDKLGRKEDARKNAEHLIRAYPTTEEANEARRWLALQSLPLPA